MMTRFFVINSPRGVCAAQVVSWPESTLATISVPSCMKQGRGIIIFAVGLDTIGNVELGELNEEKKENLGR